MNEFRIKKINKKIKKLENKVVKKKLKIGELKIKRYNIQCEIDLKKMRLRSNEKERKS